MKRKAPPAPPPVDDDVTLAGNSAEATVAGKRLVAEVVVPVIHETAEVTKRLVERDAVTVSKIVTEHEEIIPTPAIHDEIEIEHVARNTWLDKAAKPRREGDTLIIPVMEEVVVVEKRILLREELYIRTKKVTVPGEERVTLRREEVRVNRKKK